MSKKKFEQFDRHVILWIREYGDTIGRVSLFIIFFWFGILKVFLLSPAGPLVSDLLNMTFLKVIHPDTFQMLFGAFECILGGMFLFPKIERITFLILIFHLFTTIMPLYLLPQHTWDAFLVPTLVGQYIIKNAALLALSLLIFAHLKPMTKTHSVWGEVDSNI